MSHSHRVIGASAAFMLITTLVLLTSYALALPTANLNTNHTLAISEMFRRQGAAAPAALRAGSCLDPGHEHDDPGGDKMAICHCYQVDIWDKESWKNDVSAKAIDNGCSTTLPRDNYGFGDNVNEVPVIYETENDCTCLWRSVGITDKTKCVVLLIATFNRDLGEDPGMYNAPQDQIAAKYNQKMSQSDCKDWFNGIVSDCNGNGGYSKGRWMTLTLDPNPFMNTPDKLGIPSGKSVDHSCYHSMMATPAASPTQSSASTATAVTSELGTAPGASQTTVSIAAPSTSLSASTSAPPPV